MDCLYLGQYEGVGIKGWLYLGQDGGVNIWAGCIWVRIGV
jgi:hypothetical protein